MSPWRIRQLAFQIKKGAVFCSPTDTIWGFGCHPLRIHAVQHILQLKQRPVSRGLILLSADIEFCKPYIAPGQLPLLQQQSMKKTQRPVTWLVEASHFCPPWLTGNSAFIAIRITSHPLIQELSTELKSPIVSTSANISARPPVRNNVLAHKHFRSQLDYIIPGDSSGSALSSEIRELQSGKIIRA